MRVTRKIEAPRGGPWNKTRTDTVIVYDHTLEEVLNEFVQENDMTIPGDDYGDWYSDENDDRKKKIWKEKKVHSVLS